MKDLGKIIIVILTSPPHPTRESRALDILFGQRWCSNAPPHTRRSSAPCPRTYTAKMVIRNGKKITLKQSL